MFSHTGREIAQVSKRIGINPYKVIANKRPDSDDICEELNGITFVPDRPSVDDYRYVFESEDVIVTMHGWMRIIPPEICDQFNILNLHPGLITRYPELKGKDPQQRVFNMLNPPSRVGCVIHQATAELDGGRVLMERSTSNMFYSPDQLTSYLHRMATDMWVDYFETTELLIDESVG